MNALLPIIEELASARDHGERAYWLLGCPLSILLTYQGTIRNRLQNAFFDEGVAYLDAELALARQVRADGIMARDNPLRHRMMVIAYPVACRCPSIPTEV